MLASVMAARGAGSEQRNVRSFDDGKKLYQTSVRWTSQVSTVEPPSRGEVYLQIQEVNKEADDTLDFVCRASDVLCNTICVTILIGITMAVPVGMVSCGIKYLSECPKQPKIPVYLMVGGCLGTIKIIGMLWRNIQIRRYESMDAFFDAHDNDTASGTNTFKFMDGVLSTFLFGWQITGSYWVFSIWEPHYKQLLHEPSNWCDQTVYMFSVIQILSCYAAMCLGLVVLCCLASCYKYTSVFDA
ncbi:transmembrane protein 272-like isoform X2 [Gigantopelta aegis]|uniref:transmembrane protein 272-like isoform X2 n=1 Tax=Gigantopelta aegis TaxID=1735272 RepID=UPI001B88C77D|nr:transmembrane protein 272-like isoform X2 [Gigantopelta aegis]